MIKTIVKRFIKNHQNVNDKNVRQSYGVLAGTLGIICNLFLFLLKLSLGLFINSIAVITDAFNNLTDFGSSAISIFGAKLSNNPPDSEHPYGHGRFEYIASLVVAFIIISVGIELLRGSFNKILHPEEVLFSPVAIFILILSVLVKLWMFSYNRYIGTAINSSINRAVALDSLSDAAATSAVILGIAWGRFTSLPADGVLGLLLSVLVIYTGFSIARDTVDLLLGVSPEPELAEIIKVLVSKGEYIIGVHDLRMHDYGPGRVIASIHAEVPDNIDIVKVHSVIDEMEEKISDELGIEMIIHMDPLSTDLDRNEQINANVAEAVKEVAPNCSIENLRVIDGEFRTSIIFDLLLPAIASESEYAAISQIVLEKINKDSHKIDKESCQKKGELNVVVNEINSKMSD